jgi:hypothetical protein
LALERLQNRLPRFNSGRGLHNLAKSVITHVNIKSTGEAASSLRRADPREPSP